MIRNTVSFAVREAVLLLLLVVSLIPALFVGALVECASLQLFAISSEVADLPRLSAVVAETVAGYHGLPVGVTVALWLLSAISFLLAAVRSESSLDFRLRFLSAFLLIWSTFLGFASLVLVAWALPRVPLIARLDENWISKAIPLFIVLEFIVLVGLAASFAVRATKSARADGD